MPHRGHLGLVVFAALCLAAPALAQSATQTLHIEIRPISRLAVTGALTFTLPSRSGTASVVASSATYAITTNEDNRRILVAIDEAMPAGASLRMRMTTPSGTAGEELTLSTEPQTAVAGISRLNAKDLGIDFALVIGDRAVIPAATTRTVKVTLVSGA
jgi:hypothetical protein